MLIALRIAFYLQFLLGAARFLFLQTQAGWTSWITNERLWETHTSLGVLVAVLALIALRPHPRRARTASAPWPAWRRCCRS